MVTPDIYWNLTTSKVLTMEYVRGATTVFAEAGVGRYCARDYDEAKGKLYKRQL